MSFNAFTLPALTAAELCSEADPPDSDRLLGPLVTRAGRLIVVGDSGHGKTMFVLQALAAILDAGAMLGHVGAGRGPVLLIDAEQGRRSIKRALRQRGLDARGDLLVVPVPDGLALDAEPAHLRALEDLIAELRPAVVVLDPYYKLHRGEANEERAVVDLMRKLDALRVAYEFALVLPAHPRKDVAGKNGHRKLTLHDVAGSGALVRGAEVVIALERLSHGYARLRYLKDREGDLPVGEAVGLIYSTDDGYVLDPREELDQAELDERLLGLAADGRWRTVKEWREELKIGQDRAKAMLDRLTAEGELDYAVGPPGRSPKAKCWRTASTGSGHSGPVESVERLPGVVEVTDSTASTLLERERQGESVNDPPLIGDPDYLGHLFAAFERGVVTEGEWHQGEHAHRLVVAARDRA